MESQIDEAKISLDLPQREGKEGYIGTFFALYLKLGSLLSGGAGVGMTYHISLFVELIISTVPGNKRETIRTRIRERLAAEAPHRMPVAEREHKANLIYIEELSAVTDFIDEHIGLSNEHKIGIV